MIWLILVIIFSIWFIYYLYYDGCSFIGGFFFWLLMTFLVFLLSVAILGFCSCIAEYTPQKCTKTSTEHIIALNDSSGVNGRTGFLGSGYVEDELYYYYMADTEEGFRANKIKAENTYVRYSDEPMVEKYTATNFKNKLLWLIALPTKSYHIVYIPEGSIIENYRIDLKQLAKFTSPVVKGE